MKKVTFLFLLICSSVFSQSMTNFTESDVQLNENRFKLFGTLCLPQNIKSKIPIVLLISGSGPTDRNGNNSLMINNSLKYLAHNLAINGIASIRYDKRGIGESSISNLNESELTFDNYIEDAKDWITLIKKR